MEWNGIYYAMHSFFLTSFLIWKQFVFVARLASFREDVINFSFELEKFIHHHSWTQTNEGKESVST